MRIIKLSHNLRLTRNIHSKLLVEIVKRLFLRHFSTDSDVEYIVRFLSLNSTNFADWIFSILSQGQVHFSLFEKNLNCKSDVKLSD